MRHSVLVLAIVLQSACAVAAEVVVGVPATTLVPTARHLRDRCVIEGSYDACTRFVEYRLEASCALDAEGWRVHASAMFTPAIFLYDMHQLAHEHDHIRDVETSLQQYFVAIEALRFASEADCVQRTVMERHAFEKVLRAAAKKSNAMRHPLIYP